MLVAKLCLTLSNPMDCSRQASLSMEFFRLEYWSGYLFPSPGNLPNPGFESMSPALQVDFLSAEPPEKLKNIGVGSLSLLQGISSQPGIELGSLALQVGSSPTELSGKPKNTGVGSLSLFQEIFLT